MKHSASQASLSVKVVEKERIRRNKNREKLFFILGTVALVVVVVLWSASFLLTKQMMLEETEPFIITVASCLSFLVYFVFLVLPDPLIYILQQKKEIDEEREMSSAKSTSDRSSDKDTSAKVTSDKYNNDTQSLASQDSAKLPPLTLKQTAKISFVFFLIYFASNFLCNFSLDSGSVSRVSNLSSTSGFFTLLLGYYWGAEEMSVLRLGAVLLSFTSAVLLIAPGFELTGPITQASFMALCSAFAYGCYSIYLKVVTKDESRVSMPILFAFVGLYTLVLVVPTVVGCHLTGLYTFAPLKSGAGMSIAINAILGGLIPNYMWNVAFAFTTPLVVAIGLSFSTPLGLLSDWYLDEKVRGIDYIASGVVILSFATLNVASLNKKLDNAIDDEVLSWFNVKRTKKSEEDEGDNENTDALHDEIKLSPCQVNNTNSCCKPATVK